MTNSTSVFLLSSLLALASCTSQPQPEPESIDAVRRIEVVVHRGANALAPENTLPSADSALVHGADWIEVDVRTSRDGVLYNLHDAELDRTTNGSGIIGDWLSADIDTLDAGQWFAPEFRGLRVPTIASMLDGLRDRALVYFDVKDGDLQQLVMMVRQKGFADRSFFWFGKEEMLRQFLTLAPEMKVKVNANDIERLQYWMQICQPAIVETHVEHVTPTFIDFCSEHGIRIMVAAQGESADDYRRALQCGADMINLDKPEIFETLADESITSPTADANDCGIVGDGTTLNTSAIQHAVDSLSNLPQGGTLRFGPGRYLTGLITLKSNVTLQLHAEATILGSTNPYDYDRPAAVGARGDEDIHLGLFVAHQAENLKICGQGTIDGQGLDLALAIDSLHHTGERIDPAYNLRRMRPTTRPKLMFFDDCRGIDISGVTLRNSSGWGLSLHKSSNIQIAGITVYNRAYWNNDGIDLNDCSHALVKDCNINSADDGICLKSDDPTSGCDDITIRNCAIVSSASAFKCGSASYGGFRNIRVYDLTVHDTFRSAIALETVDGGVIDNITIERITARNTGNPLFICLGARHDERPGICRNITIRHLSATVPFGRPDEAYDLRGPEVNYFHNPWPSSIAGLPGRDIENIVLEDLDLTYPGRATKGMAYVGLYRVGEVNEAAEGYPEFSMYGELPSWAFYLRHIKGVSLHNVTLRLADTDFRPAIVLDDVKDYQLSDIVYPEHTPKDLQVFDADAPAKF